MDWIKRNLYFLIGGVVALALMGMAGFFLYSKWQANNAVMDQLNADYEELRRLNTQDPHPGVGETNNIKAAEAQTEQIKALIQKSRAQFKPIAPIPEPEGTNVTDREFSTALARTLELLQREATNASVVLPDKYNFSFSSQYSRLTYAAGSPQLLSYQLGEVKAICDVLYAAKVNSLDSIRREKVSTDDQTGNQTDYIDKKSTTNNLAVLSPYEVTFRCFSSELAAVLAGFAASPYGLNVLAVNVELAPAAAAVEQQAPIYQAPVQYQYPAGATAAEPRPGMEGAAAAAAFQRRYGIGARGGRYGPTPPTQPQPQPVYTPQAVAPTATAAGKGGLQTVLDEKQLKATLMLQVVKLLPPAKGAK